MIYKLFGWPGKTEVHLISVKKFPHYTQEQIEKENISFFFQHEPTIIYVSKPVFDEMVAECEKIKKIKI